MDLISLILTPELTKEYVVLDLTTSFRGVNEGIKYVFPVDIKGAIVNCLKNSQIPYFIYNNYYAFTISNQKYAIMFTSNYKCLKASVEIMNNIGDDCTLSTIMGILESYQLS